MGERERERELGGVGKGSSAPPASVGVEGMGVSDSIYLTG